MLSSVFNYLCISSRAAKPAKKVSILGIIIVLMINILVNYGWAEPVTVNPRFSVERIFTGHFEPSSMTFLAQNDILVLDRDAGKVYRVTNGDVVGTGFRCKRWRQMDIEDSLVWLPQSMKKNH